MIVTVEYDMIVVAKIYSCVMGNYFIVFTFCESALIRGCCLFKSLFYECITVIVMRNQPLLEEY